MKRKKRECVKQEYLPLGEIVGTHGLRGELRLQPACDGPEFCLQFQRLFFAQDPASEQRVSRCRVHRNLALLTLEGISSIEAAEALRGTMLYFLRTEAQLEDGQYFITELLGCEVFDADAPDVCYGRISGVSSTKAHDIWHLQDGTTERLLPYIPDVVRTVDLTQRRILITPLVGLFDA